MSTPTNDKKAQPRGWHNRGYLPHFDGGEITQFITLHLDDALPGKVLQKWKNELVIKDEINDKLLLQRRIEKYIDQGFGRCYLKQKDIAKQVQDSLLHFHEKRYKMISWVIMPNHIHFLFRPFENRRLEDLMHSIKSYTAQQCNKILNRRGAFWQEEYFDRYIRDYDHYLNTIHYIQNNPVKAKLCKKPKDWKYGSAYLWSAGIPARKEK